MGAVWHELIWSRRPPQADFAMNLTSEINAHGADLPGCGDAVKGWARCTTIGGFLMSWVDEYWKVCAFP